MSPPPLPLPPPPFMSLPLLPLLSPSLSCLKHSERGFGADAVALAEEIWKASEHEFLEASIEAAFKAIRSRGIDSHVIPSHCGENFFLIFSCLVRDLNFLTHFRSEFVQTISVFVREITKPAMYLFMEIQKIDNSYYPEVYMKKEGPATKPYIKWAASMATSLDTGVPCIMYMQADAPNPIVSLLWWNCTLETCERSCIYCGIELITQSFDVKQYHEGTNFSRTTGGLFVATSYDYDVPLDEYGIIRQPKWGHLKDLHKFIKLCEEALIATDPAVTSLHPNIEVVIYKIDNVSAVCINTIRHIYISNLTIETFFFLSNKASFRCLGSMQKIPIINRFQAWQMLK
ncbi:hypothetical protein Ahy_B10g102162 isoform E [Arachis hypogaea]|uniref:beta-galactosidase n=1 Tax=Arachis hypogaea TaxID=3818 RepID=A0A444X1D6_ARAHY|nr:hypothetical protein Ahy_B10g102162 isoform E [Arachis hypogaea]